MFKRNLVIGGLVAGAFLLPSLAFASVTGKCVNCHTMHNSQNGAGMLGLTTGSTAKNNLLGGTGCTGCHAQPLYENASTGRTAAGATVVGVPQVDYASGAGYVLNGGYFTADTTAGSDTFQHNVVGLTPKDNVLATAPGGTLATQLECQSCHTAAGHHQSGVGKYRMLEGTNNTNAAGQTTKYGPIAIDLANDVTVGDRSVVIYQATQMNQVCADCHSSFHGLANTGAGGTSTNTWVRHPTGVQVVTGNPSYPSIKQLLANADTDKVVVGTTTEGATTIRVTSVTSTTTDATVMCISCHVPHGGPYADLLAFNYTASENAAGDGVASNGCELCHSYGAGVGIGM